ncbi:MAG: DUF1016 N-terminal domain-containing protein [Spirochaetia bacterium]|nr:DUF1016 N-terminal domain-containing protein [Spirochaetia bacterium]
MEEELGWGKSVVKNLSDELQKEFIGMKGFSVQNLWNMRLFYLEYNQNQKQVYFIDITKAFREIGWSHNLTIIQQCKDLLEREFYIRSTKKFGWTYRVLI